MQPAPPTRADRPRKTGVALLDECIAGVLPGLGLVLTGPLGTGRTVLCLQLAAAAIQRGERVVLLTAEPPVALLRQAESLAIELVPGVDTGRLVLLEMVADVANVVRGYGLGPLAQLLRAESPDADLWIVDPLTALTQDLLDEKPLRAGVGALLGGAAADAEGGPPPHVTVVTADSDHLRRQPALERALSDGCGSLLYLGRDDAGERSISVLKSRVGQAPSGRLCFEIGHGGALLAKSEEPDWALRSSPAPAAAPAARAAAAPLQAEPLSLSDLAPLPAASSAPAPAPLPASALSFADLRPRVLLVDRDEAAAASFAESLSDRYDVMTATDGFSALSSILSAKPDVVVLDLFLGDVSGYDVLRALARTPAAPPVLAVSDRLVRAADRIRALVLGAADVLPKSSARFEVRLKIDGLLGNPRPRRDLQLEVDAAELLTAAASKQRRVSEEEFRTRIERAQRFGERFGVSSTTIAIQVGGPEELEAVVQACEGMLRAEDALLPIDDNRALLLAVASGIDRAPLIVKRLRQQAKLDGPLAWGCRLLTAEIANADWSKYFEGIELR